MSPGDLIHYAAIKNKTFIFKLLNMLKHKTLIIPNLEGE